jgi:hypothetical protein
MTMLPGGTSTFLPSSSISTIFSPGRPKKGGRLISERIGKRAGTMQVLCSMWCSNSWRKCLIMPRTGMAAASPRAQMVRPMMFSATLSSRAMSLGLPWPRSMRSTMRQSQPVPSRQGVHWPHDSCM